MQWLGYKGGLRDRKETGMITDAHCGTRPHTTRPDKRSEIVEGVRGVGIQTTSPLVNTEHVIRPNRSKQKCEPETETKNGFETTS